LKKNGALIILLFFSINLFAQSNLLEKTISVDFRNITMYDALIQIEKKAGLYFSYDNQFIKNQKRLSFSAQNRTVREILDLILDNNYHYIINNNKIVIRKKEQQYIVIHGRFLDNTDQKPIEYVTVYEPELKIGTMSNDQGNFSIKIPLTCQIRLQVRRVSYYDTLITIDTKSTTPLQIGLTPKISHEEPVTVRTIERHWLAKTVIGTRQKFNSLNLKNYFYKRKFQFGFWPGFGTKNALKGQQENFISFNLLGGYTAQVDAVEIGGLFNIVQKHAHAVQIGGMFNTVGGKVTGLQIAGLYNYAGNNVKGLQIGGLINMNRADNKGVQIGGIYNHNQNFKGLQIGGLTNSSREINKGVQISGMLNTASTIGKGLQLAGVVNNVETINGAQISGLINISKKTNGFQLGMINISDSLNGVSLGPINYSRNGKHALSVSVQENNQLNLSYKSGSHAIYNIVQTGVINTVSSGKYYIFGYGLGTEWQSGKKVTMAMELVSLFYSGPKKFNTDYSNICLQPLVLVQLKKDIQLFAGPRLQYQLPVYQHSNEFYNGFQKSSILLKQGANTTLNLGFNVGVNIF
jgi:hypothetical protein